MNSSDEELTRAFLRHFSREEETMAKARPAPPKPQTPLPAPTATPVAAAKPVAEEVDEELVAASIPDETVIMWITPEMAALWLHRNRINRPVRKNRVVQMARDIAADQWVYTGEAIKFNTEGELVDGQHRLSAVLKADQSIKSLVVVEVPVTAQAYMDAGAKRTAGDALSFQGEVNSTLLAATCRLAATIDTERVSDRPTLTHAEIIEWLTEHPEIRRAVNICSRYSSRIDIKPSVMAYALWRMSEIDQEEADLFFTDLLESRTEGSGDPLSTLIDRMRKARRRREKLSSWLELHLLTRTWNARRNGQLLHRLMLPENESELLEFE